MFRRSCLPLLVVAVLASSASANGRPPQSVKVAFRPGNSTDIMLGVTFGLMLTRDDAVTWRWICESAVGFQGTFDPDYEFGADGTIWATTFAGLRYTRDACNWSGVGQPLGEWLVTAVEVAGDNAVYAGAADPVLGSGMFKSTDNGASFVPTGNMNQVFDWYSSVETAPSAPQNLYVTGYRLNASLPRERLLFRSTNGGTSWEKLSVGMFETMEISELQVAAISPTDPDVVFVRVTLPRATVGEAIYRTTNWTRPVAMGGPTWTKVLDLADYITGVSVRTNGEVFATTNISGLQKSTDGGATFAPVAGVNFEAYCITERPTDQSLWMCASHLPPHLMALGRSNDGNSWMTKLRYEDMLGPVRCDPGTDQQDDCTVNLWCGTKEQFGVTSNEIDCSGDAGVDGPGGPPPKDGCCDSSTSPGGRIGLAMLVLVMLMLRSRVCRASRASIESPTGRSSSRFS